MLSSGSNIVSPVVTPGVIYTVSSGVIASGADIQSLGRMDVIAGGTSISTLIEGTENLLGGTDSSSIITGVQVVSTGGVAYAETVASGGTQSVENGGTASGTVIFGNEVLNGGTIVSASLLTGDLEVIGGTDIGMTVAYGAVINVNASGSTTGTVLGNVGDVSAGSAAGEQVHTGGSASGTIVYASGDQALYGGTTTGTVIASGGKQDIENGTAFNDIVSGGGTVFDGDTLSFSEGAGTQAEFAGILSGPGQLVQSGPGTLLLAGSTGTLDGFYGQLIISGGTLELANASLNPVATIDFANSATPEALRLDDALPPITISGMTLGDTIDLRSVAFDPMATHGVSTSGNTVTLLQNGSAATLPDGTLATLVIDGAANLHFSVTGDDATGTDLTIACYCADTLILTDRGERAVQDLAIGDRLVTGDGSVEPIRWIGRRSYAKRFLAGRRHLLPIVFCAGALGAGLPRRDLRVSPTHAILLDGVLVPAAMLVNGMTITQDRSCETVTYFHVELRRHSVILAEGAASESFVDDNSRGMFDNAHEFHALYPAMDIGPAYYCAPRVESGYALEAIRAKLESIAKSTADAPSVRLYG